MSDARELNGMRIIGLLGCSLVVGFLSLASKNFTGHQQGQKDVLIT